MKIQFWSVGKSHDAYIKRGVDEFTKRVNHYYQAEWLILPTVKNAGSLPRTEMLIKEGESILNGLKKDDYLIALDEGGRQFTSVGLAELIQSKADTNFKQLIFLIGGIYGLDGAVLKRADLTWSLSLLVFPHQLVRLILAEQVYRACTIIRNEKYHHS